jgi:hypothetical protein
MSSGDCPAISVVLSARHLEPGLAGCLDSLARQTVREDAEIIVALGSGGVADWLRGRYPAVRFLEVEGAGRIPELLKRGLEQARGIIVVVTGAHCVFPPDWLEKLRGSHDSDFGVIGGAVEHGGPQTLAGWACYFADYGPFMLPAQRRTTPLLAGNHISYKRSVLEQSADSLREGYWKVFLLWDLDRRGVRFLFDPDLVIWCTQEVTAWNFARRYYRNAFQFAAMRSRRLSPAARLGHMVTAPALPPLLLYRRLSAVWGKRKNRGRLVLAIPWLALFVTLWSAGELVGYLLGGDSLSE